MARFKGTALVDGKETEVELDDAQFITVEQHNVRLADTVRKRLARQAAGIREELAKDEEFVGSVLKAKGVDPSKGGKSLTDADVARLQEELRKSEVSPLTEKLTKAEEKASRILRKQLISDLTAALIQAGVKKSVAPRIAEMEANSGRFGHDETTEMWAVKDGDGFAFSTKASKERPYKGVDEYAAEWAGDKSNTDFIEDTRQRGPNLGDTKGGKAHSITSRKDFKTDAEKAAFISEHGLEAFQKLPSGT